MGLSEIGLAPGCGADCKPAANPTGHRDGVSATMSPMRRAPVPTLDELISGASERVPLVQTDGKSGSTIERVVIDGERYVLKVMHPDLDWIARVIGDIGCWPARLWTAGLLDEVPPEIDHAVVAVTLGLGRNGWGGALLMRDVSEWLLPEGDATVPLEVHLGLLDHMAALHARFWGFRDTFGLLPLGQRYTFFSSGMVDVERARGFPQAVPRIADEGWRRFSALDDPVARRVWALHGDSAPLVAALEATPQTFVQGDWKMGNLGRHPDGRTILLDWAYPGEAPPTVELAWYLALNAARLPHAKEDAAEAYRGALERRGVATAGWWDRQLALALLGGLVLFGWEKVLGAEDELGWWLARAEEGLAYL
jgi:hypothetical protein